MRSHELVWIAGVLECVPQVEVLAVRFDEFWLTGPGAWAKGAEIDVHAASVADALLLVEALRLREDHDAIRVYTYDDGESKQFRSWRGWSADASRVLPVAVTVTAAEVVPTTDGTDRATAACGVAA